MTQQSIKESSLHHYLHHPEQQGGHSGAEQKAQNGGPGNRKWSSVSMVHVLLPTFKDDIRHECFDVFLFASPFS